MKAIYVENPGGPDELQVRDAPVPSPHAGEVSIDVEYAGVGFVDTLFRAGAFPLSFPFTPGIEVAGRIREIGRGVDGLTNGQRVVAMLNDFGRGPRAGGYAEVAVAHATMVTPVPDDADLSRVLGALVNGVTAWIALHDLARLAIGDDVLVLGASGGLGGTCCRIAAIHPARAIIGVVGSDAKRSAAPAACSDVILACEIREAVSEATRGRGVDVAIDPVGGHLRAEAYEQLADFGRLLVLGNVSGEDRELSSDAAWLGTRQLVGLSLGGVAHLIPDQVRTAADAVVQLVVRGVLSEPAPAVEPLERVSEVHRALEARTAPSKTVLAVRADA